MIPFLTSVHSSFSEKKIDFGHDFVVFVLLAVFFFMDVLHSRYIGHRHRIHFMQWNFTLYVENFNSKQHL